MNYRYLPTSLHQIANAVADFFKTNWGVTKFKAEEPISDEIDRRPTLQANGPGFLHLCVEVSESPYPVGLESFVTDCITQSRPIRLFVAVPAGQDTSDYRKQVNHAKGRGVGVLEVSGHKVVKLHDALPFTLVGVRGIDLAKFPHKYRYQLSVAENTFRSDNPSKGCGMLYDEIEALSRNIAKKTRSMLLWRALKPGEKAPRIDLDKGNWAIVLTTLMDHLDFKRAKPLNTALLARVLGITPHRNDASHLGTLDARVKRDRELRTRFESATDLLYDLVTAARRFRV